MEALIIGLGFFVAALVSSMLTRQSMTNKAKKESGEEAVYHLVCSLAPRDGEEENWQIRVVFTTPIGTRCQYYIEVNSKANECEAVKLAYDQAIGFLRGVKF